MKKPKILLYDIETAPNLAYVWGKYEQNVIDFKEQRSLLSFSYKWVGQTEIHHSNRYKEETDENLVIRLATLLEAADIVVAHNGDQFDRKILKTRMLYWKMRPLKPNCSIDTKKVAKAYFSFNGNSLNDLCKYLKLGAKIPDMPFSVWTGCMEDDKKSWKIMKKYNNHDVHLLNKVYERVKPWIENHPTLKSSPRSNSGLNGSCPNCQSTRVRRNGTRRTLKTLRIRLNCQSCGKWWEGASIKVEG